MEYNAHSLVVSLPVGARSARSWEVGLRRNIRQLAAAVANNAQVDDSGTGNTETKTLGDADYENAIPL